MSGNDVVTRRYIAEKQTPHPHRYENLKNRRLWQDMPLITARHWTNRLWGNQEIRNLSSEYNQQDAGFLNVFISIRHSTCFRRFICPSSGAQNCTRSIRYLPDQYLKLYVQFWAPADGRKNCLKCVERRTEIKTLWNFASFVVILCENLGLLKLGRS